MTIWVRGGGDLASGVAYRLHQVGLRIFITEVPQPLAVRRLVSFSEAVYQGEIDVEGVRAVLVETGAEVAAAWQAGRIPVLVDPSGAARFFLKPRVLVDARMTKKPPGLGLEAADVVVGLGPGFTVGVNCHAAIETQRGHTLGRVLRTGSPAPDTGLPDLVDGKGLERVLRAPLAGEFEPLAAIGDRVNTGQVIAQVGGVAVRAPFDGVLRGLLPTGIQVNPGLKIGDVDPRGRPEYCRMVSDKSLAIGGGVLEAVLSRGELRAVLWD